MPWRPPPRNFDFRTGVDSADARAASSSRVTTNSRSRVLVWFTSVTVTSASGAQGASTWRKPPRGFETCAQNQPVETRREI